MRTKQEIDLRAMDLFGRLVGRPGNERFRARLLKRETPEVLDRVAGLEAAHAQRGAMPTVLTAGAAPDPQKRPDSVGPFKLVEQVGRGGMGDVWRAQRADGLFDQVVAIKFIQSHLDERAKAAFEVERRILAQLSHPDIVRLIDGGVSESGQAYLIMDFVDGQPIDVAARGLSLRHKIALFRQVTGVVQYAHSRLIAHGDLKPANILVDAGGRVRLLDFGIAGLLGQENNSRGLVLGAMTREFASPQRLSGEPPSIPDDVFALGKILALTCGPEGDADLRDVVAKATAENEGQRYGSAAAFDADLGRWQEQLPVEAHAPSALYNARKFVRRHRFGVGATALSMVALLGMTIVATTNARRAEAARARADQRFAQTRFMADYLLFDLEPQLARLSGSLPVRQAVTELSSRFLQSLQADVLDDPALAADVVRSHSRLARIYGYDVDGGLGDFAKAEEQLRLAKSELTRLGGVKADPKTLQLATGEEALVEACLVIVKQSGEVIRQSEAAMPRAIAAFDRVLAIDPNNVDANYGRWKANVCASRVLWMKGKAAEELVLATNELSQQRPKPSTPGQQADYDFLSTATRLVVAEALAGGGRHQEALAAFRALYSAVQEVMTAGRGSFPMDIMNSTALAGMGQELSILGPLPEAIADYHAAVAIVTRLQQAGQNEQVDVGLASLQMQMAQLQAKSGQMQDSTATMTAAIESMRHLIVTYPHNASYQRYLAIGLQAQATDLERMGARQRACSAADDAWTQWSTALASKTVLPVDEQDPTQIPRLVRLMRVCQRTMDLGLLKLLGQDLSAAGPT